MGIPAPSDVGSTEVALGTLAVRPCLPIAGQEEDFHLQVGAPCRGHKEKGASGKPEAPLKSCGIRQGNQIPPRPRHQVREEVAQDNATRTCRTGASGVSGEGATASVLPVKADNDLSY